MYLYETHLHSKEGSKCGHSSARELVHAYHQAGYSGFVLTNHFITGNTSVPRDLDWSSRMQMYYDAYLEAKDEGDKLDFDVMFGIEHNYGNGKEVLIYGIDLAFLTAHPELDTNDIDIYARLVHEAGGILVHAHPHRKRAYIPEGIAPRYDVCDGIEVYNACDFPESNAMSLNDAIGLHKLMTSGGDIHVVGDERIGLAGMVFEKRIKTIEEFVAALRMKEGNVMIDGQVRNDI
ncbi:MAG: hypothetical protein IJZ53_10040 [Tyzzerella sp.]|nr:hypothetical protein [Tyzzerella sp.]